MKLTETIVDAAQEEWGFNCGPGALCAVAGLSPEELKPTLESVGWMERPLRARYTNPTMMFAALARLGVDHRLAYRGDDPSGFFGRTLPDTAALVRVQWGGPWTKPGVPMRARYRQTHWIATRPDHQLGSFDIFDVNAISGDSDGWIENAIWSTRLVPWLCKQCVPKWDGTYWFTHVIEVLGK